MDIPDLDSKWIASLLELTEILLELFGKYRMRVTKRKERISADVKSFLWILLLL